MQNKLRLNLIVKALITTLALSYQSIEIIEWMNFESYTSTMGGFGLTPLLLLGFLVAFYRYVQNVQNINEAKDKKQNNLIAMMSAILFSLIMASGKYYQYRILTDDITVQLTQSAWVIILFIGYYFLFKSLLLWLLWIAKKIPLFKVGKWTELIFEKHPFLFPFLLIGICYLPYVISFFPCTISFDASYQIGEYMGEFLFTDHHTPLITLFYGFFVELFINSWNYLILFIPSLLQVLLTITSFALVFNLMKDLKTSYWIRWITLIFYALFTLFPVFSMTYVKDASYFPLTVLFTTILTGIVKLPQKYTRISWWILLFGTTCLMCLVRNNGIFVLLLSIPVALVFAKQQRLQLLALTGIIFLSYFAVTTVGYDAIGVHKNAFQEDTTTFMYQQTARYVKEHPEDVTPEEQELLSQVFEYWQLPYAYDARNADMVKECLIMDYEEVPTGSYALGQHFGEYVKVWFNQFLRHPMTYIGAFIESSNGYYYPELKEVKEGLGHFESLVITSWFQYEDIGLLNPLRKGFAAITYFLRDFPLTSPLYNSALYVWAILLALTSSIIKKKKEVVVVLLPVIVNVLVCMISPISGYTRYVLPTFAALPFILMGLWECHIDSKRSENEI